MLICHLVWMLIMLAPKMDMYVIQKSNAMFVFVWNLVDYANIYEWT